MVETVLLTDAAVRRYKPSAKLRWIRDAGARSLYLLIAPRRDGDTRIVKSWLMRFRDPRGRPRKMVLGPFDLSGHELKETPQIGQPLGVAAARALAADIYRRRALGEDVIGQHKARKIRRRSEAAEKAALTFGACAVEFFRDYKTKKWHTRPRRWLQDARTLGLFWPRDADPAKQEPEVIRGGLAERWADKAVAEIDEADILAVVDDARKHGIPGLDQHNDGVSESRGRRMHAALSVFFRWLQARRRVLRNPCRDISHPGAPPPRERVLSNDDELRWFWAACGAEPLYAPPLRLLVLSGQRLSEVAGMRWSELSDDRTLWTIPSTRAKNHREHVVSLAPLAREQLANVKTTTSDLVFSTTGTTPVSGWNRLKCRLDRAMLELARQEHGAKATIPHWRFHDLRRTFVTGLGDLGIRTEVIELAVNHQSGLRGGPAGTYNKSKLLPERGKAFECWARFVPLVADQDLYAAHKMFLTSGDDETRKEEARKAFNTAIAEGGDQWSQYLKTIAGEPNVFTLHKARGRRRAKT
jgi:integrase